MDDTFSAVMVEKVGAATFEKWQQLLALLKELQSAAVAFSGGVDSGLLSVAAYRALGSAMRAYTIQSPVDPPGDGATAQALAGQIGFALQIVAYDDLGNADFVANPADRCYHCKLARLKALIIIAHQAGLAAVVEGSNADDSQVYRPGRRALAELGVRSPLAEVGLTKAEIRTLAKALQLGLWNRPSAPCLATRFPYGEKITLEGITQVRAAEAYLHSLGFSPVRVRHHGALARLEVAPHEMECLAAQHATIVDYLKQLGFTYAALDLAGYRSGSMDEVLER